MNKRFRRVSSAALSLLLIASPVSPLLYTLPVLAEETELAESYTFDGTASTRVSITDQLPAYGEADTMIWSGTFQANASNNAIVALMSVCGNDNANDYMTLYVRPGTNKIGFEFRKVTGASYKVSQEANLQVGTDKHEFELVVSSKGYFLTVDGEELIASRQSGALTLMNCGYTDLRMTLGGMDRTGKSSMSDNWFFNGTMTNVAVKLEQRDVLPEAFAEISGASFDGSQMQGKTAPLPEGLNATDGCSAAVIFRVNSSAEGFMPIASLKSADASTIYTLGTTGDSLQIQITASGTVQSVNLDYPAGTLYTGGAHTAVVNFTSTGVSVVLDGQAAKVIEQPLSLNSLTQIELGKSADAALNGDITAVKFYNHALLEEEAANVTQFTTGRLPKTGYRTSILSLVQPGDYGSGYYRIPCLVRTNSGVLVTAADKRNDTQMDQYNIDTIVRRRVDGEWKEGQVIIDMPDIEGTGSEQKDSNTIDAELLNATLPDGTNRVFCLVDFFPQNIACLMNGSDLSLGHGYMDVNGKKYLKLLNDDESEVYTVREGGHIFNAAGEDTGATFRENSDGSIGNRDYGWLTGPNGEDWGSCWMYSGEDKGHLHAARNQHLMLTYSDDDGETWSSPRLITDQVKEDWMKFNGTGPGRGIQLEHGEHAGRLVFSTYSIANNFNSQASSIIYSDDYGETWTRARSPLECAGADISSETSVGQYGVTTENQVVELNDGSLLMFMRNYSGKVKMSKSTDGGETWGAITQTAVTDVYCQVAATHTNYNGKEYVILATAQGPGRTNGATTVGEIQSDGTIDWKTPKQYSIGSNQYGCLEVVDDGVIGLIYEADDEAGALAMRYTEFSMDYLLDDGGPAATVPAKTNMIVTCDHKNGDENQVKAGDTFEITFELNEPVFVSGEPTLSLTFHPLNTLLPAEARQAVYVSGNGTNKFKFKYTVSESDRAGELYTEHIVRDDQGQPARSYYDVEMYTRRTTYLGSIGQLSADWTDASRDIAGAQAIEGGISSWGDVSNATDGRENTFWHSSGQSDAYLLIDLQDVKAISGLRYLPRPTGSTNGDITEYEISVGMDPDSLRVVKSGTWTTPKEWKGTLFTPVYARYVRLRAIRGTGGFGSAAEVRILAAGDDETALFTDNLQTAMAKARSLLEGDMSSFHNKSSAQDALETAVEAGWAALRDYQSQEAIDDATDAIHSLLLDLRKLPDPDTLPE